MSVHIKPCARCRRARKGKPIDKRGRKTCVGCRWIAIAPPKLGRKSLGVFGTKEEASAALQQALVNHRRGIDLIPTNLTVFNVMERYFTDGTADLSITTKHRYRELWSILAKDALGSHTIAGLRRPHVTALYAELARKPRGKRKPLAGRTVLHLHRVLHRAFKWAVGEAIIGANVFANVPPPKASVSEARALGLEEAKELFTAAKGTKYEAFLLLALLTAARRGELCALKWESVNLDAGTVVIRSSLASTRATRKERDAGAPGVFLKGTKSGKTRTIPLDVDAIETLRRIKVRQAADKLAAVPGTYADQGFVFTDRLGHAVKLDAPTKAFREIADAAGLSRQVTLHSLRHSFASWSLANGGDIIAVQRVLGHSVPSTTLNLYGHVVEGGREKAVAAASDALRRSVPTQLATGGN